MLTRWSELPFEIGRCRQRDLRARRGIHPDVVEMAVVIKVGKLDALLERDGLAEIHLGEAGTRIIDEKGARHEDVEPAIAVDIDGLGSLHAQRQRLIPRAGRPSSGLPPRRCVPLG